MVKLSPPLTLPMLWQVLDQIKDPEIPVISIVELGLVRKIGLEGQRVIVEVTPTFAACPAIQTILSEIEARILESGADAVEVRAVSSPPWTSDRITPAGREKLRAFGLSPPPLHSGRIEAALLAPAVCPFCQSSQTELKNDFGSTLCRAIYVCQNCRQPFEQFKPL